MKLSDSSSLPRITIGREPAVPGGAPSHSQLAAQRVSDAVDQSREAADAVQQLTTDVSRDVAAANRESSISRPEDAERLAQDLNGRILAFPRQAIGAQANLAPDKVQERLE